MLNLHDVRAVGCSDQNVEVKDNLQEVGKIRLSAVCLQSSEKWEETINLLNVKGGTQTNEVPGIRKYPD